MQAPDLSLSLLVNLLRSLVVDAELLKLVRVELWLRLWALHVPDAHLPTDIGWGDLRLVQ